MHALLDWCYYGNLDTLIRQYGEHQSKTFRARLYQVADKYDVTTLKKKIEDSFGAHIGGFPRNMTPPGGEEAYYGDVAKALKIMYEMPDSATGSLRRRALTGWRDLLRAVLPESWFQDLIAQHPALAQDVLKLMGSGKIGVELGRYKCWECKRDLFVERQYDADGNEKDNSVVGKCPWCKDQWMESEEEDGHIVL